MRCLVYDTLHCFCTSADEEVKATHVPVRRCACCCCCWGGACKAQSAQQGRTCTNSEGSPLVFVCMCVCACMRLTRRRNANTQRYDGLTAGQAMLATQQLWEAFLARRFAQFTVDFNWWVHTGGLAGGAVLRASACVCVCWLAHTGVIHCALVRVYIHTPAWRCWPQPQ